MCVCVCQLYHPETPPSSQHTARRHLRNATTTNTSTLTKQIHALATTYTTTNIHSTQQHNNNNQTQHQHLYTKQPTTSPLQVLTTWTFLLVPFLSLMFDLQPVLFSRRFALAATLYLAAGFVVPDDDACLPPAGLAAVADPEDGRQIVIDCAAPAARARFVAARQARREAGRAALAQAGARTLTLPAGEHPAEALGAYLRRRARRGPGPGPRP